MYRRSFYKIASFLIMLCLVTAGISPACQFISGGKSLIEICSADGTLKTIEIAAGQSPLQQPADDQKKTHLDNDCAFCFTQAHQASASAAGNAIIVFFQPGVFTDTSKTAWLKNTASLAFEARGPPSLLS
jgi:hypothetical protein